MCCLIVKQHTAQNALSFVSKQGRQTQQATPHHIKPHYQLQLFHMLDLQVTVPSHIWPSDTRCVLTVKCAIQRERKRDMQSTKAHINSTQKNLPSPSSRVIISPTELQQTVSPHTASPYVSYSSQSVTTRHVNSGRECHQVSCPASHHSQNKEQDVTLMPDAASSILFRPISHD